MSSGLNEKSLDYAWKWFEYHATQRLVTFRYYLIVIGILAIALNNSLAQGNFIFVHILCAFGVFISIAFLIVEVRNESLVNLSRDALKEIESGVNFLDNPKLRLVSLDRERKWYLSHKFWFRTIFAFSICAFLIGAINPRLLATKTTHHISNSQASHTVQAQ